MDIFIPKIEEVFMSHDSVIATPMNSVNCRFKCVLRGADGRIKQENPWQDNLVTDYGTSRLRHTDYANYLGIATGTTAPAFTDTALSGFLFADNGSSVGGSGVGNSGAPDYIRKFTRTFTFSPGQGTGTVASIGLQSSSQSSGFLCTHALLDTPIPKGASDELTITYQIFYRCDLGDVTGVVNIGGEDFNYVCRVQNVDVGPFDAHVAAFNWIGNENYRNSHFQVGIGATILDYPNGAAFGVPLWGAAHWDGGSLGSYYNQIQFDWGVDSANDQTYKSTWGRTSWGVTVLNPPSNCPGWGFEISRVADGPGGLAGSGIYKENTHVMGISIRMYANRYIP